MPVLSNPRHERMAQFLAQGDTAVDAHEKAGYVRHEGNAAKWAKDPRISGRVAEISGNAAKKAEVTVESLIAECEEIRRLATADGQYSAAVAAVREKGVLSGQRIERAERGPPGGFAELSDEQVERLWQERMEQIAAALSEPADDTQH